MAYVYDSSIIYDRGTRIIRHQLFALCQTSDKELIALFYLALLLLSSASFSILLAQKMKKKED